MRERRSWVKIIKLLGVIFMTGFVMLILYNRLVKNEQNKTQLISPISDIASFIASPFNNKSDSLKKIVQDVLKEAKGSYGIFIKNLKTGEFYTLNEHKVFEVASLYKIWIMAVVLDQIENGKLKGDEEISEDV